MAKSENLADLQKKAAEILKLNIDRYNPDNIKILEPYVDAQAAENGYDLEANLLLLKLYQLHPHGTFNASRGNVVTKILLKALMQLPNNDYQICKALADPDLCKVLKMQDVRSLETLLETCQFEYFWEQLDKCRDSVAGVEGFEVAIRNYICSVIGMTNQTIGVNQLQAYLGRLPFEKFKKLVEDKGWKIQQNSTVLIRDQAASIKSRKIAETIDFADVATVLGIASHR